LESDFREELIKLLKEYKDCFAWDYSEIPGLDRSIVEHRLPIKSGFKPYKQPPWKIYKDEVLADVKKEVERLLDANFIRPCRYAEWISNIVPVYKKNGKMRVCIDFRDLNRATPMDGYPMPVANLLVDAAAGHKVISFMDGNAGYNQIFMAIKDIKDSLQMSWSYRPVRMDSHDIWVEKCRCNLSASHELHLSRVDRQNC
jgi:hypothetical protein